MKIISCGLAVIFVLSLCFMPAEAQGLRMSEEGMGTIFVSVSERVPLALALGLALSDTDNAYTLNLLFTYKDARENITKDKEIAARTSSVINRVVYKDSWYWCGEDGYGPGTGTSRGCISMSYGCCPSPENSLGTIRAENIGTVEEFTGDKPVNTLRLQLDDWSVGYTYFGIDAIQIGPTPHQGPSLGSFYVSGVSIQVTGTIDISVRK